jgi:hypothetical protein
MARDRFGFLECNWFLNRRREAVAVELPASQLNRLFVPFARERQSHLPCIKDLGSLDMGLLRQRMALRSASARLSAHSAWLQAAMPLGQRLLGGCAAKWITRQCE